MFGPALWLPYSTAAGEFGVTPFPELTLLIGHLVDGDPAAGLGDNAGRDDVPMEPAHQCAANDWRNRARARIYFGAYRHLFALRFWDLAVSGNEVATSVPGFCHLAHGGEKLEPVAQYDARYHRIGTCSFPDRPRSVFGAVHRTRT
jgi:hypothetical protein